MKSALWCKRDLWSARARTTASRKLGRRTSVVLKKPWPAAPNGSAPTHRKNCQISPVIRYRGRTAAFGRRIRSTRRPKNKSLPEADIEGSKREFFRRESQGRSVILDPSTVFRFQHLDRYLLETRLHRAQRV